MSGSKLTRTEDELDEELEEELDDEWEDHGQQSAGARLLRRFGEIRKRILWMVYAVVACSCLAGVFCVQIFEFLMRPLCASLPPTAPGTVVAGSLVVGGCTLYPTQLLEPFTVYLKLSVLVGVFLASPFVFYQLYRLIAPYMTSRKSRGWVVLFVVGGTLFFAGGAAFGFFLVFPRALAFMRSIGAGSAIMLQTMEDYFKVLTLLLLGFGFCFELPLVMALFSKLGVTNTRIYLRFWRHAVLVLLVFAAFICPSTDPISIASMGVPLVGLYFLGIGFSKLSEQAGPTLLERRLQELRELAGDGRTDEDEDDDEDDDEETARA